MNEELFIWWEGESAVSPCGVFHGRKAWIAHGNGRIQVLFDQRRGWISPMEFYTQEVVADEHRLRIGE